MKKEQIKGSLSLFLAAIIWGAAFVAQSVGMDYVGPFTFNCVRTLIGGIVLIPCIAFLNRGKVRKKTNFTEKKRLLLGGICCGVALATGSTLQQFGIMYTTVGKAGFITAFYIIIVPMMLFEHPEISMILLAWKPILYAGVMSCGVAYTLQIVGQKNMNPTVASLILSLESVTSVIAGFLVLHQNLSHRELIGCGLMFIAIVLAQLPQKI